MFIFLTLGLNIGRCWLLWDDRCFGSRFRQALPTHPGGWTALTACILLTHGNSRSVLTVWWEGQNNAFEKITGGPSLGGLASASEEWEHLAGTLDGGR